jgi:benzoate 4-monooxygenase
VAPEAKTPSAESAVAAVKLPPPPGWSEAFTPITGYHEAVEVLKHPDLEIIQGNRPLAENTLVTLRGEIHRTLRRHLAPLFRKELLERYETTVLGPALDSKLAVLVDATGGSAVNVVPFIAVANIIVTAAVVGVDGIDTDAEAERLEGYAQAWGAAINSQWAVDPDYQRTLVERGLKLRQEFAQTLYADSRARRVANPTASEDLLSILLTEYGSEWSEERLLDEVVLFVNGSSQTTTAATSAAVVDLGTWLAEDEERRPLTKDIDFLMKASNETNRLHPSQPAILREALADGHFASTGRPYALGEKFFVDTRSANRDPDVFGRDADRFDPMRQPLDPAASPHGVTFGGGPHICIARPMAIGHPRARGKDLTNVGAMTWILSALFGRGMRLDPAKPPQIDPSNSRGVFKEVWVTFDPPLG